MQAEAKKQTSLGRAIEQELEFLRSNAKGQQKKGKARMRRYDELVDQVGLAVCNLRQCTLRHSGLAARDFRLSCQRRHSVVQAAEYSREQTLDRITIPTGPRLGKEVVSVSGRLRRTPVFPCDDPASSQVVVGSISHSTRQPDKECEVCRRSKA